MERGVRCCVVEVGGKESQGCGGRDAGAGMLDVRGQCG